MSVALQAQREEDIDRELERAERKDREIVNQTKVDSVNITTYGLADILDQDTFKTKGLTKYFQQYDPARQQEFEYGHLGNLGSAAYPFVLDAWKIPRYSLGLNQYQLYQKTEQDILFFKQNTPFSELYFTAAESQSDLRVKTLFSRPFANGVNWVIQYDRISQAGIYNNQAVKQTAFLSSLSYRPRGKRLSMFANFIINNSVEQNNGGVDVLDDIITQGLRRNVSVFLTDATSRLQNQTIKFDAFYQLGNDTIDSPFQNNIQYEFKVFNEFFRYSDKTITSDSSYYRNYAVDTRGVRNYMEHDQFRNSVFFNSKFSDIYKFKTGLSYDLNNVLNKGIFHEVYLRFSGNLDIKKRLNISADAYYGLLNVANEFGVNAKATLNLTEKQGFNFGFQAARYSNNFVQDKLILNEAIFYEITDPKKILLQSLSAEYYNNALKVKVGGKLTNTFNYIYFDTLGLPQQHEELYTASLLYLSSDFKYKSILIENFLFLQNQSIRLNNLPSAFTKNSISFYGNIFKNKMLLKAGIDFRYIINSNVPRYQPVNGQFQLNTSVPNKSYPLVDARISFKVSSFTTFFKYENLYSFLTDEVEYLVLAHPQFDARFRFGIQWNLWN